MYQLITNSNYLNACNRTRTCGALTETDYESVAIDHSAIHAKDACVLYLKKIKTKTKLEF